MCAVLGARHELRARQRVQALKRRLDHVAPRAAALWELSRQSAGDAPSEVALGHCARSIAARRIGRLHSPNCVVRVNVMEDPFLISGMAAFSAELATSRQAR